MGHLAAPLDGPTGGDVGGRARQRDAPPIPERQPGCDGAPSPAIPNQVLENIRALRTAGPAIGHTKFAKPKAPLGFDHFPSLVQGRCRGRE
jgi:hypothetical protein